MNSLEDNKRVEETPRSGVGPDISLEQATAESVSKEVFDHEFANLKKELQEQRAVSWQIVIGVAIAFLIVIGLAAIEIMIFHTRSNKDYLDIQNQYFQEIKDLREVNFQSELRLQKEIDDLKQGLNQNN